MPPKKVKKKKNKKNKEQVKQTRKDSDSEGTPEIGIKSDQKPEEPNAKEPNVKQPKDEEPKIKEPQTEEPSVEEPKKNEQKSPNTNAINANNVTQIQNDSDAFACGYLIGRNQALPIPRINPSWIEYTNDKVQFIKFLQSAVNAKSPESNQLYKYLLACFSNCDSNFDGIITFAEFHKLIEMAAAAPRRLGLAPTRIEIEKKMGAENLANSRKTMFTSMVKPDQDGITFDAWLKFSISHIREHVVNLVVKEPGYTKTGQDFIDFFKEAIKKNTTEWKYLYNFLANAFVKVDLDHDGTIGYYEFDNLLLRSTQTLKQFGFPIHKNNLERIEYHKELFHALDKTNDQAFNLHEWIDFVHEHISSKVAAL